MKHVFKISAIAFLVALLPLSAMATSFGANITIPDNNGTGTDWYGAQEDQEVEPGMATGQGWDLEGFFLNGTTLSMVGGFNFRYGNPNYTSGDIFIDMIGIGKDAVYGDIHGPQNSNGNYIVDNTFGYDYVIDLNFAALTYDVYAISGDTQVETAHYIQNQGSSPWRYVSGGTGIDKAKNIELKCLYDLTDVDSSLLNNEHFLGGSHNAVSVNLGFLPHGTDFIVHFTMGCGNDNLMGKSAIPNPEPATLFMMGCGLLGLAGMGRKKFSK